MLPITNIVFDNKYEYGKQYLDENLDNIIIYGKLYINDDLIGTIPYISQAWGIMYDTSKEDKLAWDKIYRLYEREIFDKIFQKEPHAVTVEIKEYGSLNIKNKDNRLIKIAFCHYLDDEWIVVLADLNSLRKVKVTQVEIHPPRHLEQ